MDTASASTEGGSKLRVVDVLRAGMPAWLRDHTPSPVHKKVIRAVLGCRTAALGGHMHRCVRCGDRGIPVYNPCRNRHCPNCQALDQARWVEDRQEVILPVGHFHVVFTLPSELRTLAGSHPAIVYDTLFLAVRDALVGTGRAELHGDLGITAVLHTWTRNLLFHPHIHCIVAAGAWTEGGWVHRKGWLLPVRLLKAAFRAHFLLTLGKRRAELGLEDSRAWRRLMKDLPPGKKWVVFTQAPMSDSVAVVKYLGNYTHRVGISDWRLREWDGRRVTFVGTRDERVRLAAVEFADRFLLHVLPTRFRKIRHYGLYAPGAKKKDREAARAALMAEPAIAQAQHPRNRIQAIEEAWDDLLLRLTGHDAMACPRCGRRMLRTAIPRAPP